MPILPQGRYNDYSEEDNDNSIDKNIDIDNLIVPLGQDPMPGQEEVIFVLNEKNIKIPKPNYYKQFKEIIFETTIPFPQNAANAIMLASIVLKKGNISIACHVDTEAELKKAILMSNQFGIPLIVKINNNEIFKGFIEFLCRENNVRIPVYPFAYMVKDYTMSLKKIPIHISGYGFSHKYSYLKTDYRMVIEGYPVIGHYLKTFLSVLKTTTPITVQNQIPEVDDVSMFHLHDKGYDSENISIINAIDTELTKNNNATAIPGGYRFLTCTTEHYFEYEKKVVDTAEKYHAYILPKENNMLDATYNVPAASYSTVFMRDDLCEKYPGLNSMKSIVGEYINQFYD